MKRKKTAWADLGGGWRGAHPPGMTCGFCNTTAILKKYADMYDLILSPTMLLFFVCLFLLD